MTAHVVFIGLPRPGEAVRWTPRRKTGLLDAIDRGALTEAQAALDYALSAEELAEWRTALQRHGLKGLRTTRAQQYRPSPARSRPR